MKDLLEKISKQAIELGAVKFTAEQKDLYWLGITPATLKQVAQAEKRLGLELPEDYKAFLFLTNGFSAPNFTEPGFENVENIGFLKFIDPHLIQIWMEEELIDIGLQLGKSIAIAGIHQEQYFLLIPPSAGDEKWKYWKWANWYPGEVRYESLEKYFQDVLEYLTDNV